MSRRGEKLYVCPECGKRGVSCRMNNGGDHWGCRYCDWFAYAGGEDRIDVDRRFILSKTNPDREVWVTGLTD